MAVSGKRTVVCGSIVAALLLGVAGMVAWRLTALQMHLVDPKVRTPNYKIRYPIPGLRGGIYARLGRHFPFAASIPVWDYHVDPRSVNLRKHSRQDVVETVATALKMDTNVVRQAFWNMKSRYVPLTRSSDDEAHRVLTDRKKVSGVAINERHERRYPQGKLAAHVIGFVSKDPTNSVGGAGIELRYETMLKGLSGWVEGEKDARGQEIYDRRIEKSAAQRGADVFLTIDHNLQYETEKCLYDGFTNCQAEAAWAVVLDVRTGAVLAMASMPTFAPESYNRFSKEDIKNRVVGENYEPGSVMKTITACASLNEGLVSPDTMMNTDRNQDGYYKLPGDVGHVWEATMSVREALVHSSNIVYGKLAYNLGPRRLRKYQAAFGFGRRTGIDLPGEESGILPPAEKWDKASWSRAGIGQYVAVTPIQLASAYAAIGNDGRLMRPYVVDHIVSADGETVFRNEPKEVSHPITAATARKVREMMLGVAKKGGTARRAAVKGYTVAGKTGTAQIPWAHGSGHKGYEPGRYNGSFVGIVPATDPRIVVLVTFHKPKYCRTRGEDVPIFNHQGGICAAPVFARIAGNALRYLEVEPDVPAELVEDAE